MLAQSLLKCGEKPESLTHLDKRSSAFGRLSQVKPLECSISRKKPQKVILRRRFGFLTFNKCDNEINREKILALITVVLAVAPLLVAGWASPSNPSLA